jgi:uncharacterized protein YndB with AHSA1/START domain
MAADPTPDLAYSVTIAAAPHEILPFFTDAELLVEWMGESAELHPTAGGRFAVDVKGTHVRGTYVEVSPERVVFTWGFAGSAELPPGSSTVEVTLTPSPDGTVVSLRHTGLPPAQASRHRQGWPRYLETLARRAESTA